MSNSSHFGQFEPCLVRNGFNHGSIRLLVGILG